MRPASKAREQKNDPTSDLKEPKASLKFPGEKHDLEISIVSNFVVGGGCTASTCKLERLNVPGCYYRVRTLCKRIIWSVLEDVKKILFIIQMFLSIAIMFLSILMKKPGIWFAPTKNQWKRGIFCKMSGFFIS